MPPGATPSAAALLPRPNPGPEPWPAATWPGPALILLAALWVVAGAWWAFRQRRRRDAPAAEPRAVPSEPSMAVLAERVRDALVARFGPSWASRTTEEVAASAEVAESLGRDPADTLVRFLAQADRAKFGGGPDQGPEWADWVSEFVASSAGASSTINGR
jgi:hypothetical protein